MTTPRGMSATEGASTVELALVLPVLLLLLIGILDSARAINAYVTISNASREGAHYAALHPTASPSAIKSLAVVPHAQQLNDSRITVTASSNDNASGVRSAACPAASASWPPPAQSPAVATPLRIDVSYPWSEATFFLPFVGQVFGNGSMCASSTVDTLR